MMLEPPMNKLLEQDEAFGIGMNGEISAVTFGLYAQELSLTEAAVFGALEAGQPIICSMRPGDFTTAGHFIVLTGTQDGLLCVVDPNSPARSASLWEYSRLEPQIKNLWAYTA